MNALSPATRTAPMALPPPCGDGCSCGVCAADPNDPAAAFRARDAEVEAHELAHLSAAGPDASGGPVYEFKTGPDGRSYRMGGHVNVSLRDDDSDPAATVQRMLRIQRAALAPATPSSQDQRVAAEASVKLTRALSKLAAQHAQPTTRHHA